MNRQRALTRLNTRFAVAMLIMGGAVGLSQAGTEPAFASAGNAAVEACPMAASAASSDQLPLIVIETGTRS